MQHKKTQKNEPENADSFFCKTKLSADIIQRQLF